MFSKAECLVTLRHVLSCQQHDFLRSERNVLNDFQYIRCICVGVSCDSADAIGLVDDEPHMQ